MPWLLCHQAKRFGGGIDPIGFDKFDFNQALEKLQSQMEQHLSKKTTPNRRNGYGNKTVKSAVGSFRLNTPRDRESIFFHQQW